MCDHCHVRPVPLPLTGLYQAAVAASERAHGPQFRAIGFRLCVLNLDRLQMHQAAGSVQAACNAVASTPIMRWRLWGPTKLATIALAFRLWLLFQPAACTIAAVSLCMFGRFAHHAHVIVEC